VPTRARARRTKGALSPAVHGAGVRDLIRVHGACVNNLEDVSIEIRSAG